MKKVELTADEIQVLAAMIDIAVRAKGLELAANAVHLIGKLQQAEDVQAEPAEE